MRGPDAFNKARFTTVRPEDFVPANDPLRPIRQWVDEALARMDAKFSDVYEAGVKGGRPSIAPEKLIFGAQVYAPLRADTKLSFTGDATQSSEPFFMHFRELDATKSGGHHPEGCFWIQTATFREIKERVSILDIAPTILAQFGVVGHGLRGRALFMN
jgi:hypothetical protein